MNEALADVSVQKMSVSDTWKDLYRIVLNANIIIERVTGNDAITQEAQTDIIADATFITRPMLLAYNKPLGRRPLLYGSP